MICGMPPDEVHRNRPSSSHLHVDHRVQWVNIAHAPWPCVRCASAIALVVCVLVFHTLLMSHAACHTGSRTGSTQWAPAVVYWDAVARERDSYIETRRRRAVRCDERGRGASLEQPSSGALSGANEKAARKNWRRRNITAPIALSDMIWYDIDVRARAHPRHAALTESLHAPHIERADSLRQHHCIIIASVVCHGTAHHAHWRSTTMRRDSAVNDSTIFHSERGLRLT